MGLYKGELSSLVRSPFASLLPASPQSLALILILIRYASSLSHWKGMASPLLGVAAVNSLLFTAFSVAKRIVSPYPDLSIAQVSLAGGMAGGVNALLASPGEWDGRRGEERG